MPHVFPLLMSSLLLAAGQAPPSIPTNEAQSKGNQDFFSEQEISYIKQLDKAIDPMISVYLNAQLKFYESREAITRIAKLKRALYTELVKTGFSKEEAIQIVANTQLPTAPIGGK